MAPRVCTARDTADAETSDQPMVAAPDAQTRTALEDIRRQVEENSDYVGKNFAEEARSMHLGDTPERSIYGEANAEQAKSLIEDGVPVLPLPFTPKRKTN